MNQLQAMIDGMSAKWQQERAESQMTLGKLIDRLDSMPANIMIEGIEKPHSYRGYYSDLAFERAFEKTSAWNALALVRSAMGEVFVGYKGGDFKMGRNTPVWIAHYGECGEKIMALGDDGVFVVAEDSVL